MTNQPKQQTDLSSSHAFPGLGKVIKAAAPVAALGAALTGAPERADASTILTANFTGVVDRADLSFNNLGIHNGDPLTVTVTYNLDTTPDQNPSNPQNGFYSPSSMIVHAGSFNLSTNSALTQIFTYPVSAFAVGADVGTFPELPGFTGGIILIDNSASTFTSDQLQTALTQMAAHFSNFAANGTARFDGTDVLAVPNTSQLGALLTSVDVQQASSSTSTPEPSTAVYMLLGGALLAVGRAKMSRQGSKVAAEIEFDPGQLALAAAHKSVNERRARASAAGPGAGL